jgi:diguanylate cyclase (GGDEF)-like protein
VFSPLVFLSIFLLFFATDSHAEFDTEASLLKEFNLYASNTKDNDTLRVQRFSYFLDSATKNNWQHVWVKIQINKAQLLSGLYQLNELVDVISETLPVTDKLNLFDENTVLETFLIDASSFSTNIKTNISPDEILARLPNMKNERYIQLVNLFLASYFLQKEAFLSALPLLLNFNLNGDRENLHGNGEKWLADEAIKACLLSEVYFQVGDFEKYKQYTDKAIALYEQMDDLTGKAIVMYNVIEGLILQRDFGKISSYLSEWEYAVIVAGDVTIEGDLYRVKGILALQKGDYPLAKKLLLKSKAIYQHHHLDYYAMLSDISLLEMTFKQGNMLLAKEKLISIEAEVNTYAKTLYLIFYHQMATDIYKSLEEYDVAFSYAERLKAEQLLLAEKKNGLEILKLEYQQGIKDKELEQQISADKQHQQNTIYILIIAIIILALFIVALILYKQLSLKSKLDILANTDSLTSAPNRRAILAEAEQQLTYCQERNLPLTIVMADLDLFKAINDEFGHDVGDEVLKFFAKSASLVIRKAEYHGRFGGEEWLFVLPQTEVSFAQVLFERLNQEIANKDYDFDLGEKKLTFSMGATERVDKDTVKSMIDRADKLLYQAKEKGRHCICY